MVNPEHVEIVRQGTAAMQEWRAQNRIAGLALSGVNLSRENLRGADLRKADLRGAYLSVTDLFKADLRGANLFKADLSEANLFKADLSEARLVGVNLSGADLAEANLSRAACSRTVFGDVNLSQVKGLETIRHFTPSIIGVDTLYQSVARLQDPAFHIFLRGCGVPEDLITYLPSLIGAQQAIQFYSCFISYSHKDEAFAQRLHGRLRDAGLRVWYAPEDMKSGQKIHEQIDVAIRRHDKLLLVLSEHSLKSEWVATEIRKARKAERKENRRKLFPIRLVPFEAVQDWECFDADSGKDLGVELREYFIPDFRAWDQHADFEAAFERLLRDMRAEEKADER